MKKLLTLAAVIGAAVLVFIKVRSAKTDDDLWHDATTS